MTNRQYHDVLLVAFDVTGETLESTQTALMDLLPQNPAGFEKWNGSFEMDSWWIANDDRVDNTDTDSAVFVKKGCQEEARRVLRERGLLA